MTRDEVIRMATEAGLLEPGYQHGDTVLSELERFASLAVADAMARGLSAPIVVKTADIDPALLRDMLAKVPAMHLVPAPEPTHEAIAAAVADEREACAQVCESEWATEDEKKYGDALAAAIRARGVA